MLKYIFILKHIYIKMHTPAFQVDYKAYLYALETKGYIVYLA